MIYFLLTLYFVVGALVWMIDKTIDPDQLVPKWYCYLWWPLGLAWPEKFVIW